MPSNANDWWEAGPAIGVILAILVVAAIWLYVASRKMRHQRDEADTQLHDARRQLEQARREMNEAHRTLDEARRDWQDAIQRLTPRLEEHEKKISQVVRGLKQWQKDRKELGLTGGWEMRAEASIRGGRVDRESLRQQLTGLRTVFNSGVNRLKHVIERAQSQGASGSEERPPSQPG